MSKKISRVDKYQASADAVWAMLSDRAYVDSKYQALGDISTDVQTFDTSDSAITLKVERIVPADLPDFAKKILGDTNKLVQTEHWTASGGSYVCDLHIDFPGKPLKVTGRLEVKPTGDASADWVVNMDVKASVPLIGGKLEGVVEKETLASLDKEYAFNQEWLAGH
ncbi:MAG: DUF2505 domain-containing protein [Micrococcales bacterium]|nr:DUF2505 domain-containing protein [Micrococcales bacterium]